MNRSQIYAQRLAESFLFFENWFSKSGRKILQLVQVEANRWHMLLSVRFKNLCISHVGILSWGNLIYTNSYIDFSVGYPVPSVYFSDKAF